MIFLSKHNLIHSEAINTLVIKLRNFYSGMKCDIHVKNFYVISNGTDIFYSRNKSYIKNTNYVKEFKLWSPIYL